MRDRIRRASRAYARTIGAAVAAACAAAALLLLSAPALAQGDDPAKPSAEFADRCPGLVASSEPRLHRAAFAPARIVPSARAADEVRLTFVGHSTFLIETPKLVRIATDYNDYVRPPILPDIVTMNRAHSTHYTDRPDPGIKHVLRGWGDGEKPANIDLDYQDVRVRNVPTNIRDWAGGTQRHGNSIFIFETANLCIAHLGHLHHTLTQQQISEMGKVDVVLVPVDGSYTLDMEGMLEVLRALKPPLIVPMHYFSSYTLQRFLGLVANDFEVEMKDTPSMLISKATLPAKPQIVVLPGR